VVSREELIEAVWPDAFVEENNLSVNVSLLRKALDEASGGQKYIETVPRRGYRFTAPVQAIQAETPELIYTRHTRSQILIEESRETEDEAIAVAPATEWNVTPEASTAQAIVTSPARSAARLQKLTRWPVVFTIVAIIAVLIIGAGLVRRALQREDASASGQKRAAAAAGGVAIKQLVVLPFRNMAVRDYGASSTSATGELTDAVMARLGVSGSVNLTPQSAVLTAKMTPNNLLVAGRALQTDAVLSGALFKSDPEEVYLRLHLVSVNGGEVLWAETFKQPRSELPSLLGSIARGVEEGLQRLASAEEYERRASRHTMSREAYQLYLQGRFLWEQRHDVFNPTWVYEGETATSLNQLELAPYSLSILIDEAEMEFYQRRPGDVINKLRRALTLHPDSVQIRGALVNAYWLFSKYDQAPELVEKALEMAEWKGSPQDFAPHLAGPRKGSRDFNNLRPGQSYWYARWRAQLNQREEALDLLERAYSEHDFFIIYLKAEPFFDNLRDEPRFQELLRKVGLSE
jgi:tetratricopeptide (TPR) repeat protein